MPKKPPRPRTPDAAQRVATQRDPSVRNWGGTPTGRYLACPGSEHLHEEPIASEVYQTSIKRRPGVTCPCGTRTWVGATVSLDLFPTRDEAQERGLLFVQVQRLETPHWAHHAGPRYLICPASGIAHPEPQAVLVKKGEKAFHAKCPSCWTHVFPGPRWTAAHGYPLEVLKERGIGVTG